MNYLAHAYLSAHHPDILLGNMCSDYIKGKKQYDYPLAIQTGIRLHRMIDQFTDEHPATQTVKAIFKPVYRLYSAAIADVVYDHFLAIDPLHFDGEKLQDFAQEVYTQLESRKEWMPEKFVTLFPYMKSQNWLYEYRNKTGIRMSLGGLARRARYMPDSEVAFQLFLSHYSEIELAYQLLFPDLLKACENWHQQDSDSILHIEP